jgi:DnaK suppressor protein
METNSTNGLNGNEKEKTRYSDQELAEFKEIILKKKVIAEEIMAGCRSDLKMIGNGTDDTYRKRYDVEEGGADALERETKEKLFARQEKFVFDLNRALHRIATKTFGVCRITGELIPKERLRAVPHATLCMEVKMAKKENGVHPSRR